MQDNRSRRHLIMDISKPSDEHANGSSPSRAEREDVKRTSKAPRRSYNGDVSHYKRMNNTFDEWFTEVMRRINNNFSPVNFIHYAHTLYAEDIDWLMRRHLWKFKGVAHGIEHPGVFELDSLLVTLSLQNKYGTRVLSDTLRKLVVFVHNGTELNKIYRLLTYLDVSDLLIIFSGRQMADNNIIKSIRETFESSFTNADKSSRGVYGQLAFDFFESNALDGVRLWQHWHSSTKTSFYDTVSYYEHLFAKFIQDDNKVPILIDVPYSISDGVRFVCTDTPVDVPVVQPKKTKTKGVQTTFDFTIIYRNSPVPEHSERLVTREIETDTFDLDEQLKIYGSESDLDRDVKELSSQHPIIQEEQIVQPSLRLSKYRFKF